MRRVFIRSTLAIFITAISITAISITTGLMLGLVGGTVVQAEILSVRCADSSDEKSLELSEGEKGDIIASLASAGDVVGGYRVFLLRDGESKPVGQGLSDENGLVTYREIAPGRYTVLLRKSKKQLAESSVKLGDVLIRKSRSDD